MEDSMLKKRGLFFWISILFVFCVFNLSGLNAVDPIVGQWNYKTSNHWVKGPAPAGKPSKGVIVVTRSGGQLKMEFKSGMVFNPPQLKYFTGEKKGSGYVFSNSANVDNEGGVAANTCELKPAGAGRFSGKSHSRYSMGGMSFSWGFDIELTR
jgi:hypothetical protein